MIDLIIEFISLGLKIFFKLMKWYWIVVATVLFLGVFQSVTIYPAIVLILVAFFTITIFDKYILTPTK